jgi:Phage tail protein
MAIYDISILGEADNQITFNDYTADPIYRVTTRYPTKRELEQVDFVLPENLGVADFQTLIGSTVFLIQGVMYANLESNYYLGRQALRKLSNLMISQSDAASDEGYVPYYFSANVQQFMMVKVLYVDMQESTSIGQTQPFQLFCKVKYPVIYAQQPVFGTLTLGTSSVGTGGATISSQIPMQIGQQQTAGSGLPWLLPVTLGSTAASGSLTLNNSGDYWAYPSIQVNGPISNPTITLLTTGEQISLSATIAAGSSAGFSYDQDTTTITANNVNAYNQLTANSVLFKIPPGNNTFTLSGSVIGEGASATISFYPTWPLS